MGKQALFLGLREGVRRFFAFEADRLVAERATAGPTPPVAVTPPHVSAGRFGLIGLEDLRESLGPRWNELQERVCALAEAVIARHLTAGDVFEVQEDGSYVVLFARLSEEAAAFKCRVIGREITERLLGSDSPRLADVETVSVEIPREALVGDEMERVVAEAFAAAEAVVTSDPASPRPQAGAASTSVGPAAALPSEIPARTGLETLRPIDHEATAPARLPAWRDLEAPERAVLPAAVAAVPRGAARAGLIWRYSPVWDFRSMSLVRFRLTSGDRASPSDAVETVGFDMDVRAVSKALDDLAKLTAEGRRLSVICTVHESSLGVQWRRDQMVELIGQASHEVRRLLSLEVIAPIFAPTPAALRFLEGMRLLGVRCGVCVPVGIRQPPARGLLSNAAMDAHGCGSESDALAALTIFGRDCAAAGLDSAAHGLDSRSMVIGAIAAGIRFLSGRSVHADLDDLSRGLRFEPADLYRDLLVGRSA